MHRGDHRHGDGHLQAKRREQRRRIDPGGNDHRPCREDAVLGLYPCHPVTFRNETFHLHTGTNLGTGTPTSNRAVLRAVEKIVGKPVKVIESPRRPGDPPALYADSSKAVRELGWKVKFPDIESIVATAWKWHQSHPHGYGDRKR